MIETKLKPKGDIEAIIDYRDGDCDRICFSNTVLTQGKAVLAQTLAGQIGQSFEFFICQMTFGNNGTINGVPRFVDASQTGLFGPAVTTKNTIAFIDPTNPSQVVFTAILTVDDAVGVSLSEMGLLFANGQFYSVATFGDITKTSQMQITWNWTLTFV